MAVVAPSRAILLLMFALVIAVATAATGAPAMTDGRAEGTVIRIDQADVIVDLAGSKGATEGDVIELWRPIRVKHPVTGRMILDRFLIGSLRLTQVQSNLAIARVDGSPARPIEVGDVVVSRKALPAPAPTPAPAPAPAPTPAVVEKKQRPRAPASPPEPLVAVSASSAPERSEPDDPEARRVTQIFESLSGKDVAARIIAYEKYVRAHPDSRFAPVLYEEAAELRKLLAVRRGFAAPASPTLENFAAPKQALAGVPLEFAIEIAGSTSGAVLHSRRRGEIGYVSTPMTATGDGYYAARVPAERMRAPDLEYFVEATTPNGDAVGVVSQPATPSSVDVDEIPRPKPPQQKPGVVSVLSDYAAWNDPKKGNDWAWQNEGYFGIRFQDLGLRAARSGFGVYRGVSGSLRQLDDQNLSGRPVGLTYGYLEGEFGVSRFTGIVTRAVLGLRREGISGGGLALIRLGNDRRTNLMLGGEVLGGIGVRGITQLELATFQRFPMLFRTEVTNQPAGEESSAQEACGDKANDPIALQKCLTDVSTERSDIGARAIAQVGYRIVPDLVVAARLSYQGRTINHAGPGAGLAASYAW